MNIWRLFQWVLNNFVTVKKCQHRTVLFISCCTLILQPLCLITWNKLILDVMKSTSVSISDAWLRPQLQQPVNEQERTLWKFAAQFQIESCDDVIRYCLHCQMWQKSPHNAMHLSITIFQPTKESRILSRHLGLYFEIDLFMTAGLNLRDSFAEESGKKPCTFYGYLPLLID